MKKIDCIKFDKNLLLAILVTLQLLSCSSKNNTSIKKHKNDYVKYVMLNAVKPTPESFREIRSIFGKPRNTKIKIGIGFIISYLNMPIDKAITKLQKYLSLSEKFNMPVIVQLDGEQWCSNRPDLWNWWDKNKPGYNPKNKKNVEWTGWTPDSAVKIGWRNWGRQIRVLPMPNLMSPEYRKACREDMKKLVPIIMDWWHALPKKKEIFISWDKSRVGEFYRREQLVLSKR
jgi:hypothetical protein